MHEDNTFLTLTYNDQELPAGETLVPTDLQKFWKRFRKNHSPVRYYSCGEYGDRTGRPHYHACAFGARFEDQMFFDYSDAGLPVFVSETLSGTESLLELSERTGLIDESRLNRGIKGIWNQGAAFIGEVTFESAAYVARYQMKKITGDLAYEHYEKVDTTTGEVFSVEPEFATMSRRPGIGATWLKEFETDVFPDGEVTVRGHKSACPRYYEENYLARFPSRRERYKRIRNAKAKAGLKDRTKERLSQREQVKLAQIERLRRS